MLSAVYQRLGLQDKHASWPILLNIHTSDIRHVPGVDNVVADTLPRPNFCPEIIEPKMSASDTSQSATHLLSTGTSSSPWYKN